MDYGFIRVAAVVPQVEVGNCRQNSEKIIEAIKALDEIGVQIAVFPELCITAYTCQDLFRMSSIIDGAAKEIERIAEATKDSEIVAIVGAPLLVDNHLFDCAVVVSAGEVLGVVPKSYLPNYGEFYEKRWFVSGLDAKSTEISLFGRSVPFGVDLLFADRENSKVCFGIEICEDLWVIIPPSSYMVAEGAAMIFNPSASNELVGKHDYRRQLISQQSARCVAAYVYASAGVGESTTDVVFGGYAGVFEYGACLAETERFSKDLHFAISEIDVEKLVNHRLSDTNFGCGETHRRYRKIPFSLKKNEFKRLTRVVDAHPFVPSEPETRDLRCKEIFNIQTSGLSKRMLHTGIKHPVVGVSGGLDSTLALLVAVEAVKAIGGEPSNVVAVTMPGFGTTRETNTNATDLMKFLGVTYKEIDIKPACLRHFEDIGHDPAVYDVVYENVQARERTQILMDIANKIGGLVVGTGDLSEIALGFSTYNGDHMSMYSVNCGVPKTLVKFLVQWVADNIETQETSIVLRKILDTPITPELLPGDQKTENIVGPYELHDFFLYHMVRYGASESKILFLAEQAFRDSYSTHEISKWLSVFHKRFFSQQFKRSCMPDGPKVGSISLSPRGDWRMPSDGSRGDGSLANLWFTQEPSPREPNIRGGENYA